MNARVRIGVGLSIDLSFSRIRLRLQARSKADRQAKQLKHWDDKFYRATQEILDRCLLLPRPRLMDELPRFRNSGNVSTTYPLSQQASRQPG